MIERNSRMLISLAVSAAASLTANAVHALEGNQCKAAWNISVLYMKPVKDSLSESFRASVKSSLLAMKKGAVVEQSDGQPVMRPCNNSEVRELVFEKLEDIATFEAIEDGTRRQKIALASSLRLTASSAADKKVTDWIASRKVAQQQQQRVP